MPLSTNPSVITKIFVTIFESYINWIINHIRYLSPNNFRSIESFSFLFFLKSREYHLITFMTSEKYL